MLYYSYQFSARTSVTCFSEFMCFTVLDKVVPWQIYANFAALKLFYFKVLIVDGPYSSCVRKGSTALGDVVNKESYGAIKGTNSFFQPSV